MTTEETHAAIVAIAEETYDAAFMDGLRAAKLLADVAGAKTVSDALQTMIDNPPPRSS